MILTFNSGGTKEVIEGTKKGKEGYRVGLWKVIKKDWDIVIFKCSFMVGNGWRVLFWKDR